MKTQFEREEFTDSKLVLELLRQDEDICYEIIRDIQDFQYPATSKDAEGRDWNVCCDNIRRNPDKTAFDNKPKVVLQSDRLGNNHIRLSNPRDEHIFWIESL